MASRAQLGRTRGDPPKVTLMSGVLLMLGELWRLGEVLT